MTSHPKAPRENAFDWATAHGREPQLLAELRARARRRRRNRLAGLAALAVVATLAWGLRPTVERHAPPGAGAVVRLPDRRVLPDGTVVDLREGAEIRLEYTPAVRRVSLLRGEGHFTVVKDASRPFLVAAGGVEVRAVGTAFAVRVGPENVAVLVTEGRVAVAPPTGGPAIPPSSAIVEAGMQTVVAPGAAPRAGSAASPQVTAVSPEEVRAQLHWRAPRLELTATPLEDALRLFNQYSPRPLTLGDRLLAGVRISGIVRADNPEALLELLAANYGVSARETADGGIVLERRR